MRIGIITDNYFPSVGGTEISIWSYTKSLEEAEHTVFVFCPNLGRKNPKNQRPTTVRLPSIRRLYPDHPLFILYPGITKKFKSYNLDIIHSQTPISAPYIGEYVSKKLNIPHIHTMHTLVPEQVKRWRVGLLRFSLLYFVQSLLLKSFKSPKNYLLQDEKQFMAYKVRLSWMYMLRLVNISDAVIFPSKHVKDILKARGYRGTSHCLPTFSEMFSQKKSKATRSNNDEVRIISVGRLDSEKRPQVLIDAVNLLPEYINWKLIIIGTGNQEVKLRSLVRKYGLEEKIIFKGKKKQAEIAKELLNADIFVMTSYRFDTQGIVLLEACSAGLPIIYCDDHLSVGVEPINSILTKPYAMSMAEGLVELLENPELRHDLARGSLEVAAKYEAEKLTKKLIRIYKKTIQAFTAST